LIVNNHELYYGYITEALDELRAFQFKLIQFKHSFSVSLAKVKRQYHPTVTIALRLLLWDGNQWLY